MLAMEYDVAEMSLATFLWGRFERGLPIVALPIFTGRQFVQGLMWCRADSDLRAPEDLTGAQVACPQYWMTSTMWHRSILDHYYGVDSGKISWRMCSQERLSPCPPIVGRHVEYYIGEGSPVDLLLSDEVDAVLLPRRPRSGLAKLRPIISDWRSEEAKFLAATNVFPIMHLVVGTEAALYNNDLANTLLHALGESRAPVGPAADDVSAPLRFARNSEVPTLENFARFCVADGLLSEEPDLAELFMS